MIIIVLGIEITLHLLPITLIELVAKRSNGGFVRQQLLD
jgi:hypothetical protein